ncbi:MAG: hypothetical protein A2Z32_08800 [Chloroflexi bacterium RBG_16_69_14]|nr:MAG: hypothetical protein A2Z32_08800 [Chloroflexi bacterium RBG_16_69_14]
MALLVAACGVISTTPPSPTPADFPGIAAEYARHGIDLAHVVSGDAGCDDKVLAPTAISFDASGLDQKTKVRIHLYIFRNRAAFERLRATIDGCARSFVTDPETYEAFEQSPYVVAGQGPWGADFEAVLREATKVAAGTGN